MYGFGVCEIPVVLQIIYFIKILINLIKFIVPMGLIVMVSIEVAKGVIGGEKEVSKILKASGNKILAAIIIFLVPTIVDFSIGLVDKFTSYESCWANANASTIKEYKVLWDEAVAKKEEQQKKEEEEKYQQEKEEDEKKQQEKEEEEKNTKVVTVTFVRTNGTNVTRSCSYNITKNDKECSVNVPSSNYGWGGSKTCKSGEKTSLTINQNVTYYECNADESSNNNDDKDKVDDSTKVVTITARFVHSNGVEDTDSCIWNKENDKDGCSITLPKATKGWDISSSCVTTTKTIKLKSDSTFYECGDMGEVKLEKSRQYKNYTNITVNKYGKFTYWLYHPVKLSKNLPIIVYLPGAGEKGNDYDNSNETTGIQWGPIHEVIKFGASYNAIIIVMQVPTNSSAYSHVNDYIKLTNEIANKFSANKKKISIMGLSHGCYGLLAAVSKNPNYFSAAVPVGCSWNPKNYSAKNFVNLPVWAISGEGDGKTAAYKGNKNFTEFVKAINDAGGNAKYTYLEGKPHNVFNDSYSILRDSSLNVINWLTSKTRK